MPKKNILLSVQSSLENDMTHSAYQLHELGYKLFATKATGDVLLKNGVPCTIVGYPTEQGKEDIPNALDMSREKEICMVVNVPTYESKRLEDNFLMRRTAVDFGIPLLTNMQLVKVFADADPDSLPTTSVCTGLQAEERSDTQNIMPDRRKRIRLQTGV